MADTWVAHGDASGRHLIKPQFVEAMVILPKTTINAYSLLIRTISGQEYYLYFQDEEHRSAFIGEWAGETSILDLEPAPVIVDSSIEPI